MGGRTIPWLFIVICHLCTIVPTLSNKQHSSDGYPDPRYLFCDFEEGNCFWRVDTSASITWKNTRSDRHGREGGPRYDFTSYTLHGHYILFDTKFKRGPSSGVMSTPALSTANENACLTFGYHMHGYEIGGLNVWKNTESHEKKLLFSTFGHQGKRWYQASVPIGIGHNFTLEIEGTYYGREGQGNIALDATEIRLDAKSCVQDKKYEPRFDCDFDTDFCSWEVKGNWAGSTPTEGWNSGYLVYTFRGRNWYDEARLASKTISVFGHGACFTFKYSNENLVYSETALHVYSYGQDLRIDRGKKLWSVASNYDESSKVAVTIPPGENIRLAFSVIHHNSQRGDLKMDDFKLSYRGPCLSDGLEPEPKRKYFCDFDTNSTCEWFQRHFPILGKWKIHRGPTPSQGTGPDKDHTSGDGYFVYLDASRVDTVQLYSPIVDLPTHGACFSFWYHMHGEDINQLTVWIYNHTAVLEDKRKEVLWKVEGSKGDKWIEQNITISQAGDDMSVVVEATRGYFPRGDIAIDDVELSLEGPCYGDVMISTLVEMKVMPTTVSSSKTTSVDTTEILSTLPGTLAKTPEILVTGQINPARVGSTVKLECGDYDDYVEWAFANPMKRFHGRISLYGPRVILFEEIDHNDENSITCKVSTSDQRIIRSKPVVIRVVNEHRSRPRLSSKDKLDPVVIGSKIILQCGDSRVDRATYNWTTIHTNDTISTYMTQNRYIVLEHVTSEYNGLYRCSVYKDGFQTAMSNTLTISAVKGRVCQTHDDCRGLEGYTGTCVRHRCVCDQEELLRDTRCLAKPPKPWLDVVPQDNVFGVGENLNLRCRTKERLFEYASYHFQRNGVELTREDKLDRFYIYTISNASASDDGDYTCLIKYEDVSSEPSSNGCSLQFKEFVDLSCGFEKDLCNWSHGDTSETFLLEPSVSSDEESLISSHGNSFLSSGFQGAFLRSPDITVNSFHACLKFRYRMVSDDAISLSVWIYKHSFLSEESATGRNVWEAVGNQGTDWKNSSIQIESQTNFYILFQGQGRVAIDDFRYTIHGC